MIVMRIQTALRILEKIRATHFVPYFTPAAKHLARSRK